MKKKICMVTQHPMVKGGIVAVVNGYRGSKLERDFEIIYVESYKDGGKFTKLLKAIHGLLHFVKVVLIDRPNLVHIHSSFGPSFFRKLPFIYVASWFRIPIINHIHGSAFDKFYLYASNAKKHLVEKLYNKCSVLIALSDIWKEKLKYIVSEERIVVVENYSIINDDAVEDRDNRKSNNQVLFLGAIEGHKGCYDIPEIVMNVAKVIPDAKFILAGSGDVSQIKKMLKQNNLEHNVEFPGWVRGADKDRLLRTSDIFLLPSYNEGMPMSILDAMGYGLPIVSTNVGGISKIVLHNENGFLYRPGDIEGISNGIIKLLKSEQLMRKFGKKSYQIACNDYQLNQHVLKIGELYNSFIR